MSATAGRLVRILAGIVLIFVGVVSVGGTGGTILAIVGLVPLIAGLFNFCVFAPVFGGPLLGREVH